MSTVLGSGWELVKELHEEEGVSIADNQLYLIIQRLKVTGGWILRLIYFLNSGNHVATFLLKDSSHAWEVSECEVVANALTGEWSEDDMQTDFVVTPLGTVVVTVCSNTFNNEMHGFINTILIAGETNK